jgi:hypothetical protein
MRSIKTNPIALINLASEGNPDSWNSHFSKITSLLIMHYLTSTEEWQLPTSDTLYIVDRDNARIFFEWVLEQGVDLEMYEYCGIVKEALANIK